MDTRETIVQVSKVMAPWIAASAFIAMLSFTFLVRAETRSLRRPRRRK